MREKLAGIQLARGLAALLVVFFHAGRMISLPQYSGQIPLGGFFNFGNAGVDFFFVLSGFIIYFVHQKDIGRPAALIHYVWRRATRIYPIYWLVTVAVIALALLRPGGLAELGFEHAIKSFLLIPQVQEPLLGVGWTLVHEVLFYLVFALAILSARLGLFVCAGWTVLVLAGTIVDLNSPLLRFIASPYHLEFLMGAITAYAVLHTNPTAPRSIAGLAALIFLAVGISQNANLIVAGSLASRLFFGIASSFIIYGVAAAERSGRLQVSRAGSFFGGASYSLYLVHTIVIGLTAKLLMLSGLIRIFPAPIVLMLVAAVAVMVGCLLHKAIEQPLISRLNKFGKSHIFDRPVRKTVFMQGPVRSLTE